MPVKTLKRMWINQPSTLQPHHARHGQNVLAYLEYDHTYRVYFLSGDIVSMQMLANTLSNGWNTQREQQIHWNAFTKHSRTVKLKDLTWPR